MKPTTPFTALFALCITLAACGGTGSTSDNDQMTKSDTTTAPAGVEMAYACPMHPEVTGKEGDKCPKCGMALEEVK